MRCFDYVLERFVNMFGAFTPFLDGKITQVKQNTLRHKRTICPEDCLGLVPHGSMMALQLIYGMMMTNSMM